MLVTFHTKAWSNITLFGDVAVTLLKMAGHSGTIPGAFRAADIPAAIAQLQGQLANATADVPRRSRSSATDDEEPPVKLQSRALPLIKLLSAAAQQGCDVMWDKGAPTV
jgi:hypothetical protein